MDHIFDRNAAPAAEALDRLVAEHGLLRIAAALAARAFRRRRRAPPRHPLPPHDLPDAIRRDLGLPLPEPGPALALHRLGLPR